MVGKNVKKVISMVLVLLMTCSSVAFARGGDYDGHWAERSIQNWVDKGYVKGYADGTFKPENDITRAEFISIVNRSFGFTAENEVSYKDVKASHWAYDEFKRADAAGYIGGFEDGTLRPNSKITRQEVASIIARLLNLNPAKDREAYLALGDVDQIPEWSTGAVSAIVDKGYMKLRGSNFAPVLPATRAEVIAALDSSYLTVTKVKYDQAGTYTAGIVDGTIEINVKDVILEDTTINGNLIISENVGDGDVTLNNVEVKGNTIVKGGGMNSIIISDSNIANLIVEKKDGKVRIFAKGTTYVEKVDMQSGGKLESSDAKADNFGYVVIAENLSSQEPIILKGNFENIEVKSAKNNIKVESGTIKNLVVSETAKNVKINLAEGVKVTRIEINAAAKIDGKGEIKTADVNSNGVTITAPTEKVNTADGKDKPETTQPSTSNGGDTGSGTPVEKNIHVTQVEAGNYNDGDYLRITLSDMPKITVPAGKTTAAAIAMDINVTRTIDGISDGSFKWSNQNARPDWWKEKQQVSFFEINPVKEKATDQTVVYMVTYKNTPGKKANEIVVKGTGTVNPEPEKKLLMSIRLPDPITLPNGVAKTAEGLGLPTMVAAITDQGEVDAKTTWDVSASSYDIDLKTSQTFDIVGTATLPYGIANPDSVSLDIMINVTVREYGATVGNILVAPGPVEVTTGSAIQVTTDGAIKINIRETSLTDADIVITTEGALTIIFEGDLENLMKDGFTVTEGVTHSGIELYLDKYNYDKSIKAITFNFKVTGIIENPICFEVESDKVDPRYSAPFTSGGRQ